MGLDDGLGCIEHVWQLREIVLAEGMSNEEWACQRCPAVEFRQPMSWRDEAAGG